MESPGTFRLYDKDRVSFTSQYQTTHRDLTLLV